MQFETSTQAKSWMFTESSLRECRKRAVATRPEPKGRKPTKPCKFASGFHRRYNDGREEQPNLETPSKLAASDQETLLRFHAYQLSTLVGPAAVLPELRTSATVLSTAIAFFRRFYLSNSVVDFAPRKMAAACAFFASKVEEQRIEISLLSHATAVVQMRVKNAPLCRKELAIVSIMEIEHFEWLLMEGLNYEFICHHPDNSIEFLANDVAEFVNENSTSSHNRDPDERLLFGLWSSNYVQKTNTTDLLQRATNIAQRALMFSDVPFLFAPDHIALAVIAIATECVEVEGYMGDAMQDYVVSRRALQSEEELLSFSRQVNRIISILLRDPAMEVVPRGDNNQHCVAQRAEELRRILHGVNELRSRQSRMEVIQPCQRKRCFADVDFTPPRGARSSRKLAKVTPNSGYYY